MEGEKIPRVIYIYKIHLCAGSMVACGIYHTEECNSTLNLEKVTCERCKSSKQFKG